MSLLRVLVTGSQTWDDPSVVEWCLEVWAAGPNKYKLPLEVWHGACPKGPDLFADRWVRRAMVATPGLVTVQRFPADWNGPCRDSCKHGPRRTRPDGSTYCQAAGMYRNEDMISAGPSAVVGFHRGGSKGTGNCLALARRAGLPVLPVLWERRHMRGSMITQIAGLITEAVQRSMLPAGGSDV